MDNEQFELFCSILEGEEGCNFIYNGDDINSATWDCKHDHRHTKKILEKYFKGVNIKKFIGFCEKNGGYCDCEVLLNVKSPIILE